MSKHDRFRLSDLRRSIAPLFAPETASNANDHVAVERIECIQERRYPVWRAAISVKPLPPKEVGNLWMNLEQDVFLLTVFLKDIVAPQSKRSEQRTSYLASYHTDFRCSGMCVMIHAIYYLQIKLLEPVGLAN